MSNRDEVRQIARDVVREFVIQVVHPLDIRLVAIETAVKDGQGAGNRRRERFWKIMAISMAAPAFLLGAIQLFATVV